MQAILDANVKFKGASLKISRAKEPKMRNVRPEYIEGAVKLFIGAIPLNATYKELNAHFSKYGTIGELALPLKDKNKGINKGHGFVTYTKPESARHAIDDCGKHMIRSKLVT